MVTIKFVVKLLKKISIKMIIIALVIIVSIFFILFYNQSTLFTVVTTLMNIFLLYESFSISNKALKIQEDEQIKQMSDQASKIYVHTLNDNLPLKPINNHTIYRPIMIGNSSSEPIYQVWIISAINRYSFRESKIQFDEENYKYLFLRILTPQIIYKIIGTDGTSMGGVRPEALIYFKDSRGKRWLRDPKGNLHYIKEKIDIPKEFNIHSIKEMPVDPYEAYSFNSIDDVKEMVEKIKENKE